MRLLNHWILGQLTVELQAMVSLGAESHDFLFSTFYLVFEDFEGGKCTNLYFIYILLQLVHMISLLIPAFRVAIVRPAGF